MTYVILRYAYTELIAPLYASVHFQIRSRRVHSSSNEHGVEQIPD
jgi:hypothetical protein